MNSKKNKPRHNAMTTKLEGGTGPILQMCSLKNCMEIYKTDATFQIRTPENLDPKEIDPNMHATSTLSANVGASNIIVARVFLQQYNAMSNKSFPNSVSQENIIELLHQAKELLLSCEFSLNDLKSAIIKQEEIISSGNLVIKGNICNSFPIVENLETSATNFLTNAKGFLRRCSCIIDEFYKTNIKEPHFHKIFSWAKKNNAFDPSFLSFLKHQEQIIDKIITMRNAQEHPKKNFKLIIENFKLKPNKKIFPPSWTLITKEKSYNPTPILSEMNEIIKYLIAFSENIILFCIISNEKTWIPYKVIEIPLKDRDSNCPIKYQLVIDNEKLHKKE